MQYVAGSVLTENGFLDGYVGFEEGTVREVERGAPPHSLASGIILPTLINSHTHIADYCVPLDLTLPLEKIVAPPDGLKHMVLERTPNDIIIEGMTSLADFMARRGTSRFIDFREGGVRGAELLRAAEGKGARPTIMGRPSSLAYEEEEVNSLLEIADGVGISSISDWDYEELRELARHVRSKGRRFCLHASERVREDIDLILDLRPSHLIHMTMASESDLEICADLGVPIIICPRSNLFFGRMPPIALMMEKGVDIALGTDNAMISLPDILTEMEVAARLMRYQGTNLIDGVLDMAISTGRKLLNEKIAIGIQPDSPCDFMVVKRKKGDALTDLVLHTGADDPIMVCIKDGIWRGPK